MKSVQANKSPIAVRSLTENRHPPSPLPLRSTRKGAGGSGMPFSPVAREAERNMGIKPRRFRMLRLGRSASSVTVFPCSPLPCPPASTVTGIGDWDWEEDFTSCGWCRSVPGVGRGLRFGRCGRMAVVIGVGCFLRA